MLPARKPHGGTPIWFGVRSSVCQKVIERLDGTYMETNEAGQDHADTKRTTRWMAHNLVHLARILKANPIPPEGNTFEEETEHHPHIG